MAEAFRAFRAARRLSAVGLAALLGLAGCGTRGLTVANLPVTGGSSGRAGDIAVVNAMFLWHGPIGGDTVYRLGETVGVQATIVNEGATPDRLVSVSSPIAGGYVVLGPATVPGNHALAAGYTGPTASITLPDTTPIELRLTDLNTPIRAGLSYPVVFSFARAGDVRLELRVANPDVPVSECPLPPNGKVPDTYTAPIPGAPAPPSTSPPDCSSLR